MTHAPVLVGLTLLAAAIETATVVQQGPQPPVQYGERITVGADIGRYAMLYGTPEFRALDDETARPWPERHAIRTIGRLEEIRDQGRSSFRICAERNCQGLVPVPEVQDLFAGPVRTWILQEVEVVGAFDKLPTAGPELAQTPTVFLVWSVTEPRTPPLRREGAPSSLETLVRYPKGSEGREVTVAGSFRGANLFEDLPPGSRRERSDWVLRDGAFSIWVTGKPPKGKGWALDPGSRSECSWRLEVKGKVESVGGYVYLRAKAIALLRRERDTTPEP